ncbi:alpha-L-fucosidase [Filimonas lacunae]|uniref:alpha-L-fucosidase n=1 Tax=Filimonas lacunae TaxID=477680 RepID=A0A173MMC5_9BACT|nr:alpha-L-fucosidase [Filimonas lacunae]BAV08784.1 alpha-L-fucosidase [Filimonas lacunae]SIS61681.1 alpha-L-fucosidase [Filimonas lacunae]
MRKLLQKVAPAFILFIQVALYVDAQQAGHAKSVPAPAPLLPVPSAKQLAWHKMEMNAFVHFTTNTYTGLEWGNGDESAAIFNPTALNALQWATTLKKAGFKGMILTCKHHDGFCLWPSKYTEHSVKQSPWKNGKGDVVREAADACKKAGIQFGVYLSPWDRNRADYGQPSYVQYYRNQLQELFTQYGPLFEMWFDGANGGKGYYGGANEVRKIDRSTYYDWPGTLKLVRGMQPNVLFFSDAGPDLRWCGNENGTAGLTNWNTISTDTLYAGKAGVEHLLNTGSADGKQWVPSEVDVSIRNGWFYHATEDSLVKNPERLFELYLTTVGRGSTLLLNIPPDKRGLFHENDVKALQGFRRLLNKAFGNNLALHAKATASNVRGNAAAYAAANVTDGKENTYWAADDSVTTADVAINLPAVKTVAYILVQEYIQLGQRVKSFAVDVWANGQWQQVAEGTTIGYKRICKIAPVSTGKIRVRITAAKACPVISNVAVY